MQRVDDGFVYSATDLNNFLECRRLTELEELVALGRLVRPDVDDEQGDLIRTKGEQHESAYLASLERLHPGEVVRFARAGTGADAYRDAEERTLEAMRSGAKFIYQATFFDGRFIGHADFLRRVDVPSNLGSWSYEVIDTKLALWSKPYFVVQLCNYSEHLLRLQGVLPDHGYIVQGDGHTQGFRINDFMAYYRRLKARFLEFVHEPANAVTEARTYPIKRGHCGICEWDERCKQQRVADDHLSLVARMRRDQTAKLEGAGITTLSALAQANGAGRPATMAQPTYERLRDQARLQFRGRTEGPLYELLAHDPSMGFGLLPAPNDGDVYFDMEGDPLYEPGRPLEYLFGAWMRDGGFRAFWARTPHDEKAAFEAFIDFVVERRRRYPALHIYHYAPYEKVALRRLAQQHQTREDDVDDLLRGEVLVDLYAVVRQTLLISEDSYSIKRLEKFYGFTRTTDVKRGDDSIVMFEMWRLNKDESILADIEAYNRDDCESTYLLHRWLLGRREEAQKHFGIDVAFRPLKEPAAPCHAQVVDGCKSCQRRAADEREEAKRSELERRLLVNAPHVDSEERYRALNANERVQYLIAHLLAYHRREDKPAWWQYYHQCENQDELVDFDSEALGGLQLCDDIAPEPIKRSLVYTYRYPEQRHKLSPGDAHDPATQKSREVISVDDERGLVRVKFSNGAIAHELRALIPSPPPSAAAIVRGIARVAESFASGTLQAAHPATYDLLAACDPRTTLGARHLQPDTVSAASVSRVVQGLDRSYLFIQGPPGSGKSTIAAHVIADLLQAGKRVGVMSTGHKAIHHLLHKVEAAMDERGARFRGLYKHSDERSMFVSHLAQPCMESTDDRDAFARDDYALAGGTAWLFAREDLIGRFDYLFIDEAGQVPLANAVAVAPCASNVVLLGDPSQLAQVSQGTHAPHVDDSVLQHLLGEEHTVSRTRGIFLDRSYRMQPEICRFISDAMYDGRLEASERTAQFRVESAGLHGSGLRSIAVEHDGNGGASSEEADRIVAEIELLLAGHVVDRDGVYRPMRPDDVIVVTPYNAQRRKVGDALRRAGIDVRVGTVDKFQGQEASVVFYSMATSNGADGPRDLDFLFERNRFNVAISRAMAMSVLVCAPTLLDVSCRTVEQMQLVNLLCEYVERAS